MDLSVSQWIQNTWTASRPKAKSLIITLYGDAIAPHGGAMRLGDLVSLLGQFGVNERLVRTYSDQILGRAGFLAMLGKLFSFWDLLWLGLGVSSAWKLAQSVTR